MFISSTTQGYITNTKLQFCQFLRSCSVATIRCKFDKFRGKLTRIYIQTFYNPSNCVPFCWRHFTFDLFRLFYVGSPKDSILLTTIYGLYFNHNYKLQLHLPVRLSQNFHQTWRCHFKIVKYIVILKTNRNHQVLFFSGYGWCCLA